MSFLLSAAFAKIFRSFEKIVAAVGAGGSGWRPWKQPLCVLDSAYGWRMMISRAKRFAGLGKLSLAVTSFTGASPLMFASETKPVPLGTAPATLSVIVFQLIRSSLVWSR